MGWHPPPLSHRLSDSFVSLGVTGGFLRGDEVRLLAGVVIGNLTEGGQMLGVIESPDGRSNFLDGLGAFAPDGDACEMLTWLKPAVLAVGLMNCKTVHTEARSTGNIYNRRKRKQSPKLDYHVIVLPGPAGEGEGAGGHRDVRQH